MKLNKKKFMETELGHEIKDCIENLDGILCVDPDSEVAETYLVQWEAFKLAVTGHKVKIGDLGGYKKQETI